MIRECLDSLALLQVPNPHLKTHKKQARITHATSGSCAPQVYSGQMHLLTLNPLQVPTRTRSAYHPLAEYPYTWGKKKDAALRRSNGSREPRTHIRLTFCIRKSLASLLHHKQASDNTVQIGCRKHCTNLIDQTHSLINKKQRQRLTLLSLPPLTHSPLPVTEDKRERGRNGGATNKTDGR